MTRAANRFVDRDHAHIRVVPLPGRVAEAKDASGHEHDESGRFTGPGEGALAAGQHKEIKPGVHKVTTADGKSYAVKDRVGAAESAHREARVNELAQIAGVSTPRTAVGRHQGKPASVQEWAEGTTVSSLTPAARHAALAGAREQVERHTLFDYLVGHSDGHTGNFVVGGDGSFHGIDKEMVLDKGNTDERFRVDNKGPLAALAGDRSADTHPLDPGMVKDMASRGRKMAAHLSAAGDRKNAARVLNRAEVLEKHVSTGGKTVGDLRQASGAPPVSVAKVWRNLFGA